MATKFDDVRWHKGMKAEIEIHTLTRGIVRRTLTIIGVNFESELITLSNGCDHFHRLFDQIKITDK